MGNHQILHDHGYNEQVAHNSSTYVDQYRLSNFVNLINIDISISTNITPLSPWLIHSKYLKTSIQDLLVVWFHLHREVN